MAGRCRRRGRLQSRTTANFLRGISSPTTRWRLVLVRYSWSARPLRSIRYTRQCCSSANRTAHLARWPTTSRMSV
ncbi:hypothetical protein [Lysobacter gummosus]|uniref:hypothetical protein n=1 Tax=Lysobacter gummosus TaxID=262324 RepID=UPI00363BACC7